MGRLVVVGSINIDMTIETERMPIIGETILGTNMDYFMGGKGANQAVAAAKFGGETLLYGSVGDDTFGETAKEHLKRSGVDISFVKTEANIYTGMATIFRVDHDNSIVVLPGANMLVEKRDAFERMLGSDDIVLAQLEVPLRTIKETFQYAKSIGARTILNPAPYDAQVASLLPWTDMVTPNEIEFAGLIGEAVSDATIEEQMLRWSNETGISLLVTRGHQGVSYVEGKRVVTVPSYTVDVADTTGAGDTFNGILATCLLKGYALNEAICYANAGAALSVTKVGAQTGMSDQETIAQFITAHA